MLGWLLDPWSEPYLVRAFAMALVLGVCGGVLGGWLVLYRLSYSAESLSHALMPGLVIAALAGVPLVLGGAAGIVVAALAVSLAARVSGVERDTAVAVVVTGLFGLGILLALSPDTPPRLGDLLFGDVLGTTPFDLATAVAVGAGALVVLAVAHHRLLAVGFDRGAAAGLGVRAGVVDAVLLLVLALVLLIAVQALGNLLVVAILIAPPAAARLVTHRLSTMLALSAAIAVAGAWAGLYASFHLQVAAGAAITLALLAAYAAAAGYAAVAPQSSQ